MPLGKPPVRASPEESFEEALPRRAQPHGGLVQPWLKAYIPDKPTLVLPHPRLTLPGREGDRNTSRSALDCQGQNMKA